MTGQKFEFKEEVNYMRTFYLKLIAILILLVLFGSSAVFAEDVTLNVISHRYPALEFVVGQMGQAIEGVKVEGNLMPWDKAKEVAVINLSAGSDAYDIIYADSQLVALYANSGWIIPLNELMEKHEDEFNFKDILPSVKSALSWKDNVYSIPLETNIQIFTYRADLFEAAGIEPPKTIDEMVKAAAALTTEDRYGIVMSLLPGDGFTNEFHYYLNTVGGRWFDEEIKPVFNDEYGLKALEIMKELMKYAPPDTLSYLNDETTAALQQDKAAMAVIWHSRAASVNDPKASKVAGKLQFLPVPGLTPEKPGVGRISPVGYGISAFTKYDPDLVFQVLATATSKESLLKGVSMIFPPRRSILEDPELSKKYISWNAALKGSETAMLTPNFEDWPLVQETISRPLHRALTGEISCQEALDEAAAEVEKFLAGRGYYD
jgi:ABC-type glycerol-3-phosphate transport system substrate-binding protein